MFAFIIVLLLIVVIAALTVYIRRNPYDEIPVKKVDDNCTDDCATCLDICANAKILDAQMSATRYFDDSELDAFAGIAANDYDEEQTGIFRAIFETMNPQEVLEWTESLRRRGIELPSTLKDEVVMIISDSQHAMPLSRTNTL